MFNTKPHEADQQTVIGISVKARGRGIISVALLQPLPPCPQETPRLDGRDLHDFGGLLPGGLRPAADLPALVTLVQAPRRGDENGYPAAGSEPAATQDSGSAADET